MCHLWDRVSTVNGPSVGQHQHCEWAVSGTGSSVGQGQQYEWAISGTGSPQLLTGELLVNKQCTSLPTTVTNPWRGMLDSSIELLRSVNCRRPT